MDDKILTLYANGMSTRDISSTIEEMYGVKISAGLVSRIISNVMERVLECQNRPLDAIYPIMYLDCIVLKISKENASSTKRSTLP